jgi:hypothetical protein
LNLTAVVDLREAAYQAAIKYMPRFILHPDEDTFPSSVDYFLEHVNVVIDNTVFLEKPTLEQLTSFCAGYPCNNGFLIPVEGKEAFDLPKRYPAWLGGVNPRDFQSPVYLYFDELDQGRRVDVYFWTFYPYDKYPAVGGKIVSGDHIGEYLASH